MLISNPITPRRIELKEVFTARDLGTFERSLKLSSLRFYQPYSPRRINSLYFDTIDFNSLEESMEGFSTRSKVRLRWYGKQKSLTTATLEIKRKKGIFSWKKLYSNQFNVKPLAEKWVDFISTDPSCRPIAAYRIRSQRVVSIIAYDRTYYSSSNGKVRITIDENLRTFDQRTSNKPNLRFERQHLNQIVIEAKVDASDANFLPIVFDQLPFSPKRFSKYCESLIPQKHI